MKLRNKPTVPRLVYKSKVLYYTIVDYLWIDPKSETAEILKPGWFPIKALNLNHPLIKKEIEETIEEQKEILARKEINWERLENSYITI